MSTAGILHTYSRRAAFTASLVEPALAVDTLGTGNVVFATLIDAPASARDVVISFVGEILDEAASAVSTATVNVIYNAAVVEEAAATHTSSTFGTFTYTGTVVEPVTAIDSTDAHVSVIYNVTIAEPVTAVDTPSATVVAPSIYNVGVIEFTFAAATQDSTTPASAGMFGRTVVVAGMSSTFVSPGSPNPSATVYRLGSGTALTLVKAIEVLGPALTEVAIASSTLVADVTGAAPIDSYELDSEGEFTPWMLTGGSGAAYYITVGGTWSGTIMVDYGLEGPPGTVTFAATDPIYTITANGSYNFVTRGQVWLRLRMTGYVSGTALVASPVP